ncbi:DUF1439 domain-containing protein [Oceanobacter kriegii]|uniref:DUF1439 domain-containing protein n=1 Tax=Oceanobacter kriegii TaxID=64972 RepID=UPI0004062BE1|nr:DUF1439 domain-containing protein [Oceanobacter kriegii]
MSARIFTSIRTLGLALLLALTSSLASAYTIELTEAELQQRLESMMPMHRDRYFMKVTLDKPELDLTLGDGLLGFGALMTVEAPGDLGGDVKVKIAGELVYNADRGTFYLKKPKILSMDSSHISVGNQAQVKSVIEPLASKYLERKPVYTLDDEDLKQKLAKAVLKSVTVQDNKLVLELSPF